MEQYKNYHVYTRAISSDGAWRVKAVVLNAGAKVTRQLKHFDTVRRWTSKHEAEQFAVKLCKFWIDIETREHH